MWSPTFPMPSSPPSPELIQRPTSPLVPFFSVPGVRQHGQVQAVQPPLISSFRSTAISPSDVLPT